MKISGGVLYGKIPKRLIDLSITFSKRKDAREKLLKTYLYIYFKAEQERKRNSKRKKPKPLHQLYNSIWSANFKTIISMRYYKHIKFLKENKFITIKGRALDNYESGTGLLGETRKVESYKVGEYPKSYRLLEYPTKQDIDYSFKLTFKTSLVSQKNENFLLSIGITNPKITRDNYGFRLYHAISTTYKEVLPTKGDFVYYDFKTSIPCHTRKVIIDFLEKQGLSNEDPFLELFDEDFYLNWNKALNLNFEDRDKVKKQFSSVIFGESTDYSPKTKRLIKEKFSLFNNLLNKDFGRKIVRQETKLVLNEVVAKLNLERILTIHDGFIVHKVDELRMDQELATMNFQEQGFSLVKSEIGNRIVEGG